MSLEASLQNIQTQFAGVKKKPIWTARDLVYCARLRFKQTFIGKPINSKKKEVILPTIVGEEAIQWSVFYTVALATPFTNALDILEVQRLEFPAQRYSLETVLGRHI